MKVIIATLLLLFPLSEGALTKDKNKTPAQTEPPTETRVYLRRQCLLGEADILERNKTTPNAAVAGILAIFVPLLIERLLGGVAGALKKAGSPETHKDSGRRPTYLYRLTRDKKIEGNPDLDCVIVIRGTFTEPDKEPLNGPAPPLVFNPTGIFAGTTPAEETQRVSRLNANGIPVKDIVAVYEAEITTSDDKTALFYEGKFFEMKKFQSSRPSDMRAVVVSIGLVGAGENEGAPVLSLAMLNLGEVTTRQHKDINKRTYTVKGPDKLKGKRSSWLGGVGISEVSLKAVETMEFPSKPSDPMHHDYKHFLGVMPVTLEGTFIETENGNEALKFIGEVLDASKGDVAKTLSGEILKDRGKAAAEATDALEKLRQEERTAYGEYLGADAAAKKPDNPTPEELTFRQFEARRLKAIWCGKYIALEKVSEAPAGRSCTSEDLKQ